MEAWRRARDQRRAVIGEMTAVLTGVAHDVGLVASFGVLGAIGIGALATTALGLPRWVRARKAQMEELGARVSAMALKPPVEHSSARSTAGLPDDR